ncbi:2-amino-3-ketobutyrate coenzyme A ligase [Dimargaris cristalligena]|uniref:2-amino-3-ketobutyrate coenzyme A ligase, mitochondrial n=1 Tax=Dimargaris cristalligena TaxID=215637 RepID=A0A4P9ZLL8_9FUNG|nr:2-amino-3-ketobutyrate coenzyme A ligase [Dimargaris cristalligena]|eukprot:RKP34206.1 2-amino-3-ketobutyrate coenzyme A ligase [Dimargaris cristalligena]
MVTSARPLPAGFQKAVADQLEAIRQAGTYKNERVIASAQKDLIKVQAPGKSEQEVLNFCANNYLGLSSHPQVIERAQAFLAKYGAGLSSVRFICGTQTIHKDLEKQISDFYGTEDTILYASCFDANAGIFEVLLTKEDAIISDALNHASIIDGVRLCKAQRYRYANGDMAELEARLQEADRAGARLKMIATDGVFSMDGKIAPLDRICDLAEKYGAVVFVDDCHATGFLGPTGRGTPEHFNVGHRVHLVNSTLGKAMGGAAGGYTTGNRDIIALLRNKSRPYLFSNTLPPPVIGAAAAAFDLLASPATQRTLLPPLWRNTRLFRTMLTEAGFTIKGDDHPIVPVMLGDARLAAEFANAMLERNIYVIGFSYPVVPNGQARIRVQISAAHTEDQIRQAAEAFIAIGRERGIIPSAPKL